MSKLAIHGGHPVRGKPFGKTPVVSLEDHASLLAPFRDNCFSGFRAGKPHGGPRVRQFEEQIADLVGVKHAVAFDTWSNGIFASLIALGIEGGDEVILPSYTMTACASSVLSCGAVPVFADIDKTTFNIDPNDVETKITSKTKLVMAVHLFGMPADMDKLLNICQRHNLILLEDAAQAPSSTYKGQICGTIGDSGGFSFTQSKHVMCGEGGMAVTNNSSIANGLRYVRNHGEVNSLPGCKNEYSDNLYASNTVGFNFRMTELNAALACSQLRRLTEEVEIRRNLAKWLTDHLKDISYLSHPYPSYEFDHSYYCYALVWNHPTVRREQFVEALGAEGIPFQNGYCQPIYKQHIYKERRHWAIRHFGDGVSYDPMPVTEWVNDHLIVCAHVRSPNTQHDMNDIVDAINKVVEHMDEL